MAFIVRRLLSVAGTIRRRSVTALSNLILRPNHHHQDDPLPPMLHKVDNIYRLWIKNANLIRNPFVLSSSHWLVFLPGTRFEFITTEKELIDNYVQILATALGSEEEEARKRIYLVSVSEGFGFCAQFDDQTKNKLQDSQSLALIIPDHICYKKTLPVPTDAKFTSLNYNHRLENVFMYHQLSTPNSSEYPWANDFWLINIKEPHYGFSSNLQVLRHYKDLLADVLGSQEKAKDSIYVAWVKAPFGFGAKIYPKIVEKLKGRLDVLHVLPDYAFDVNGDNDDEALIIYPPSHRASFHYYCPSEHKDNSKHLTRMQKQIGASGFSTYSGLKDVSLDRVTDMDKQNFSTYSRLENDLSGSYLPECNWNVDCKHWFVSVEKPVDDSVSMQQRIDTYIKTLAMVIGSEKAKENIYRIKYDNQISGFAARMDVHTSNKLKGVPGVVAVVPDHLFSNSHLDDYSAFNVVSQYVDSFHRAHISFSNLSYLNVTMKIDKDYVREVKWILMNFPNIETLIIKNASRSNLAEICVKWGDGLSFQNLKCVELHFVEGFNNELGLLKDLLKNAMKLEEMTIFTPPKYTQK